MFQFVFKVTTREALRKLYNQFPRFAVEDSLRIIHEARAEYPNKTLDILSLLYD